MLFYQNENVMKNFDVRTRVCSNYVFPPHIHEFSEMLYVKEGEMTMNLHGERLRVPAGCAALIFPHRIHEYTGETPNLVRCMVYSNDFLPAFFDKYAGKIPKNPVVDLRHVRAIPDMLDGLNGGARILPGTVRAEDAVCVSGVLNLIYYELLRQTEMVEASRQDTSLYLAALSYISENFRNDITLSDMARALGYHEKYLSSELHALTGMNFRMFLGAYRVDYAKRLLRASGNSMTVADIALESGFISINTFNRLFLHFSGMTPSEYRSLHRG